MKIKLLILTLAVIVCSNSVMAAPFKADAKTRRIPAGAKFKLQLMDPVNTVAGNPGDSFNAMLLEDETVGNSVILPAGSVLRGCIGKVKPIRRLSRGAVLYLDFDHVVTPNGRQLPLSLSVCDRTNLTEDGGIYGSKGYGEALKTNWNNSVEITKNATQFGVDAGDAIPGLVYLTAPICAVGGAFGGGAYLVGDSVIDLFRKGQDVILNQGAILNVMLISPIDVPVN